ncbi:MAG: MerR family transcriptional regulator [Ruminococcus sp.]|nr:MerR family transcriptional regulator [Ruminococcus sp.]
MKMQIKEFAELTGVSVRTLHYYDDIGLLKPSEVDEHNGYRYYDESAVERMREIVFYRELDFSLKTIGQILSSPDYNQQQALSRQRQLLLAKKERLERMINVLDGLEKGDAWMNDHAYDKLKNQYAREVRQRWGATEAYRESAERGTDCEKAVSILDAVMEEFAVLCRSGAAPDGESARIQVEKLQQCITDHFYTCTDEILAGLGQLYVADERFRTSIDRHGDGTAAYVSACIKAYFD